MWLDLFQDFWRRYWWGILLVVVVAGIGLTVLLVSRPQWQTVSGYRVSAENAAAADLYLQGQRDQAKQAYSAIVEKHPKDWFAWNGLANIYRDKDMLAEAEEAYLKAIDINPRFEQGYRNLYAIYYAWSSKDESKLNQSESLLLAGLKLMPRSEMILEDLISYYAKVGDQQKLQQYRDQLAAIRSSQSSQPSEPLAPRIMK